MKHKVVIQHINGVIASVRVSGETEVYLIERTNKVDSVWQLEPEEFEVGRAHEAFMGLPRQFLRDKKV